MDMPVIVGLGTIPQMYIPVLIFFARILDVSIGTVRIIVVSRGYRTLASLMGFLEVFIWIVAISQVLQYMTGFVAYLFYSAGFATGTFVGMTIERRLTYGMALVRIIIGQNGDELINRLTAAGYRVTHLGAHGSKGPVEIIFSIIRRRDQKKMLDLIRQYKADAFYTVEDIRAVGNDMAAQSNIAGQRRWLQPFFWFRKGK